MSSYSGGRIRSLMNFRSKDRREAGIVAIRYGGKIRSYEARIQLLGRRYYLGTFRTLCRAKLVRKAALIAFVSDKPVYAVKRGVQCKKVKRIKVFG